MGLRHAGEMLLGSPWVPDLGLKSGTGCRSRLIKECREDRRERWKGRLDGSLGHPNMWRERRVSSTDRKE